MKLLKVDNEYYLMSDDKPVEGDYFFNMLRLHLEPAYQVENFYCCLPEYKKIIASTKQLGNLPKLDKNKIENKILPCEWEVEVEMGRIPCDLAPDGWDIFPKVSSKNYINILKLNP